MLRNVTNDIKMPTENLEPERKKAKEEPTVIKNAEKSAEVQKESRILFSGEELPNPLSKKQIKKQKKLEKYEQSKKERRVKERERQKQKRLEAKALGQPLSSGPTRKALKKRQEQIKEQPVKLNIAIDLDFDDLMHDRDVAKCVKQCLRIYTINRRLEPPGALYFTGIKTDGRIHTCFKRNDGWQNWNVKYYFDKTHKDVFPKSQLVYLTCESETVLETLEKDVIYVIGGLVDHNHHKGICHQRSVDNGLKTARLPLSENVNLKTRAVLSTFHVFEILVRVIEGKSWTEAILATLPMRKGAKPKESQSLAADVQSADSRSVNSTETSKTIDEQKKNE